MRKVLYFLILLATIVFLSDEKVGAYSYTSVEWAHENATYGIGVKIDGVQNWDQRTGEFAVSGEDDAGNISWLNAMCIEPDQAAVQGSDINVAVELADLSQINGGLEAAWLHEYADDYSDGYTDKERIGALQLAIWEVITETGSSYDLSGGSFVVNNSKGLDPLAGYYLTMLNEHFATADTDWLNASYTLGISSEYQDFILKGDMHVPSLPENLTAAAISGSQADLSWDASSDNIGVTGYEVFRDGAPVTTVAETDLSDPCLSPARTYTYTVSACDGAGNCSAQSAPVSVTTLTPEITWPYTCTDIDWDHENATYGIGLNVNGVQTWGGKVADLGVSGEDGTGNTQDVTAFGTEPDQICAKGEGIGLNVTLTEPARVRGGLRAAWLYEHAAGYWSGHTEQEKTGALQLAIWEIMSEEDGNYDLRSGNFIVNDSDGLAFEPLVNTVLTALSENFAAADTDHLNAMYTIALHPEYQDLIIRGDIRSPSVPQNLTATAMSGAQIALSWDTSSDNIGVTAYEIYRDDAPVATVAETSGNGMAPDFSTTYTYTVRACDGAGNCSAQSAPVSVTTLAPEVSWPYTLTDIDWDHENATYGIGLNVNGVQTWGGKVADLGVSGEDGTGNTQDVTAFGTEPDQICAKGEGIGLNVTLTEPSRVRGGLKAAWLYEHAAGYWSGHTEQEKTGALQLAIWEVMTEEEGNYDLRSGNFVVNDSDGLAFEPLVNTVLTALTENFAAADTDHLNAVYMIALHPEYQDLIISGDIRAPSAPENPVATAVSDSQTDLSWDAASDNVGVTAYEIYRDGAPVATVTETTWSDSVSDPAAPPTYTIRACDSAGNCSAESTPVSADTSDLTPPVVSLIVPSQVRTGGAFVIRAEATDDTGVTAVSLFVNDLHVKDSDTSPCELGWNAPDQTGETVSVRAEASDAAGNRSEATALITVTDEADTAAPVIGTVYLPPSAAPGESVTVRADVTDNRQVAEVGYFLGETGVGSVTAPPYELFFTVPADTPAGTTLTVGVSARDAAGNTAAAQKSMTVSAAPDTDPPVSVSISAPSEALAGQIVQVTASAEDNVGILKVMFLADGVALGDDTDLPYETAYFLPADRPAGTRITLTARAADFSGNETESSPVLLTVRAPEAGFVAGEVYDNSTGLPVGNVAVSVISVSGRTPDTPLETVTDTRGRYQLRVSEGRVRLLITGPGYVPVYREVIAGAGAVNSPPDARLTPLGEALALNHFAGGTFDIGTEETATLDVPAGAFATDVGLTLTLADGQGLPFPLPRGWTPVFALCIGPSGKELNSPVTLSVPGYENLIAARWDEEAFEWIRTESVPYQDGNGTDILTGHTGTVALVRPDTAPAAPAVPDVGTALTGVAPVPVPEDAAAEILPDPEVIFMQAGSRSEVRAAMTSPQPLPSGTPVRVRFAESYTRTDGTTLLPDTMTQDMVLYQETDGFAAGFSASPSEFFDPARLAEGRIRLEALSPETSAGTGLALAEGNTVALSDSLSLTFPAGAVSGDIPVVSELTDLLPSGLSENPAFEALMPRAGVNIGLGGAVLAQGAVLTADTGAAVPSDACFLLICRKTVKEETRWEIVSVGSADGTRVVFDGREFSVPNIRTGGQYFMLKTKVPVGYLTGTLTLGGSGVNGFAETDTLPFVSLTEPSDPAYFLVSPAGSVTVGGRDPGSGSGASQNVTVPGPGETVTADLSLEAVRPAVVSVTFTPSEPDGDYADISTAVTVTFSGRISPDSVSSATFGLSAGGVSVNGTAAPAADGLSAVFRPSGPLADSTVHTVSLTESVRDIWGNALIPCTSEFTTADMTPPEKPEPGQVSVPIPGDGGTAVITGTQGSAEPGTLVTVVNRSTGERTGVTADNNGSFSATVTADLADDITIEFRDGAGNVTEYDPGPFTDPDGTTVVGSEGGTVGGSGDMKVVVPPGVLPDGTPVRISAVAETGLSKPVPDAFGFLGCAELDLNGVTATGELKVSVPVPDVLPEGITLTEESQILVMRETEFDGVTEYTLVNIAHVKDGRIETASPPFSGVRQDGKYPFLVSRYELSFAQLKPVPLLSCCSVAMLCAEFSLRAQLQSGFSICIAVPANKPFTITTYGENGQENKTYDGLPEDTFGKLYIPEPDDDADLEIVTAGIEKDAVVSPTESGLSVIFSKAVPPDFLNENTVVLTEIGEDGNPAGTVPGRIILLCEDPADPGKTVICPEKDDSSDPVVRGVAFEPVQSLKYDTRYRLELKNIRDYGESSLMYGFDGELLTGDSPETTRPFRTFRPGYLGSLAVADPGDVCVLDDYRIAIADRSDGKGIVLADVTNPFSPRVLDEATLPGKTSAVCAKQDAVIYHENTELLRGDLVMAVSGEAQDFGVLRVYRISEEGEAREKNRLSRVGTWAFTMPAELISPDYNSGGTMEQSGIPSSLTLRGDNDLYVPTVGIGVLGMKISDAIRKYNGEFVADPAAYLTYTPVTAALAGDLLLAGENSRLLFLTTGLKNIGGGEQETQTADFMVRDISTAMSFSAGPYNGDGVSDPAGTYKSVNLGFVAARDHRSGEYVSGLYIFELPENTASGRIATEPVSAIRFAQSLRSVDIDRKERLAYVSTADHIWVADLSDPYLETAPDAEDPRIVGTVGGMAGGRKLAMGTNLGFVTDPEHQRVNIFSTRYCPLTSVYLEGNTDSVPMGGIAQARAIPGDIPVTWRLEIPEGKEGKKGRIQAEISESGIIRVHPESGSGWVRLVGIHADQPGCVAQTDIFVGCICSDCQSAGTATCELGCVDARFGLGKGRNGAGAGNIVLHTDELSQTIYEPDALEFTGTGRHVTVVRENGVLRQVLAPESLADIVKTGLNRYEIRFYQADGAAREDEDDLFVPAGEPFSVWRVENPDASGTAAAYNRLRISETAGSGETYEYQWDDEAQTWSLIRGGGLETLEQKSRTVAGLREETVTVRGGSGNVASAVKTVYKSFPWGESVVGQVSDPDGLALATAYTYYETEGTDGHGRVRSRTNPDGSWVRYEYDAEGRITREIRPWGDAEPDAGDDEARITGYTYAPLSGDSGAEEDMYRPRTVTEKIQGQEVGRTLHVYIRDAATGDRTEITERCGAPGASCGDAGNLRTVREYAAWDPDAADGGRLKKVTRPDGTSDTYTYEYGTYTAATFAADDAGEYLRETAETESPGQKSRQVRISDAQGRTVSEETYARTREDAWVLISKTVTEYDLRGRPMKISRSDGTYEEQVWGCCNLESRTGADGLTVAYEYDALRRMTAERREGPEGDIITEYDRSVTGTGPKTVRTVKSEDGTLSLSSETQYDRVGRTVYATDEAGLVTAYAYENNGLKTVVTRPGGATEITERHKDGRTESVSGTGVVARTYTYGAGDDGTQWSRTGTGSMWEKSYTDMLGRTVRTEKPGVGGVTLVSESFYDDKGRLIRSTSPAQAGMAPVLYVYDTVTGEQYQSGADLDDSGTLSPGTDRITETRTYFTETGGKVWQVTEQSVYDPAGAQRKTGTQKTRMITAPEISGTHGHLTAESVSADIRGNETRQKSYADRTAKTRTGTVKYPDADTEAVSKTEKGVLTESLSRSGVKMTFAYDALGRRTKVFDPRLPADKPAVTAYDAAGRVAYVQDAADNKTEFEYDPVTGRKAAEKNALGRYTRYAYNDRGQVTNVWGDVPYPVKYEYDAYGRLKKMHTFRDGAPATPLPDGDTTEWIYDGATGLLTAKIYADDKQTQYAYTPDGKLDIRTWARQNGTDPLTTDYDYKPKTGELEKIDYSDGTPDIEFGYDLLGRQTQITDAAGTRTFDYDPLTLALDSETVAAGGIYGPETLTLARKYEDGMVKGRPAGFTLAVGTADPVYDITYKWDDEKDGQKTGRFSGLNWAAGVKNGVVAYSYVPDSDLLKTVTSGGLVTTYSYEPKRNLKTQVLNSWNGPSVVSQYDYRYDELGRRKSVENSGAAFINDEKSVFHNIYAYNNRNELTGSERKAGTVAAPAATVDAEGRLYEYDPIGNRINSTEGTGPQVTYARNGVNQYTALTGGVSASPAYDDDGNMTGYDGATYTWNAENRLIAAETADKRITFLYDYMGRRVRKQVYSGTPGSWNALPDETRVFVYDGWNLIRETVTGAASGETYYVWGLDISQSMQGAGGIGGLLCAVSGGEVCRYTYDANGNVGQLVDEDGVIVARYEYDPFGNEIVAEGSGAQDNPFRFSTKYLDDETGLYYYGFRYYSAELGRWINRDPLGEEGGYNLYAFVFNNSFAYVDPFGMQGLSDYIYKIHDHSKKLGAYHLTQMRKALRTLDLAGYLLNGFNAAFYNTASVFIPENDDEMFLALVTFDMGPAMGEGLIYIARGSKGLYYKFFKKCGDDLIEVAPKELPKEVARTIPRNLSKAAGKQGCFVAGTPVRTIEGLRFIEDIEADDFVLARDTETGEFSWRKVVRTFVRDDQQIIELKLEGENGTKEKTGATVEHPFWVKDRGWVGARELLPGDEVFTSKGGWLKVTGSTWLSGRQTVYNFEVDGLHNYFVGELGAWVHNESYVDVSKSDAIKPNEVTTFQDFKNRSVVGDNLEGHEVLQHANLNERGLATTRLSTDASKNNPVIALERSVHKEVNAAQRGLNPRSQTGVENINSNIRILQDNPNIPNSAVDEIERLAHEHNSGL